MKVRLPGTGLDVSRVCLGGNVFGWTLDERASFAVLDAYAELGGNFIDTADVYGRRGEGAGSSERLIGRWMADRGNRDSLVIATKVGMSSERPGLSAANIRAAAEDSLGRLGVARIDLYYAHADDSSTPLEETLGAFTELAAQGRIAHAAASNYSAERLREALAVSAREGLTSYVALQPHYNLLERSEYEGELAAVCTEHGLGCVPYFGLARGFLSGKYAPGAPGAPAVDSPRAAGVLESYGNQRGYAALEALREVAEAHAAQPAATALAWLLAQPNVIAPIASATSPAQLAESMPAMTLALSPQEIARLDGVA